MKKLIIPVLPIPNIVFFPNTSLPLYIEEPSYIKLVKDCIEKGNVMAISLAQPVAVYRPQDKFINKIQYRPSDICGIGKPIIIEEFNQKAIKVLVKGTGKVKLSNLTQNLPYPAFEAEIINQQDVPASFSNNMVERINSMLNHWVQINVNDSLEREAFFNGLTSIHHIMDYVSMLLINDKDVRQLLLETDSIFEKIHMLNLLLKEGCPLQENQIIVSALKHFEIVEKVAKVAH